MIHQQNPVHSHNRKEINIMRMWMLPPHLMCTKHRVGEHGEIHKHLPSLRRGIKITGRFFPIIQIELCSIQQRHDELAKTMNHKSPLIDLPDFEQIYPKYFHLKVDIHLNARDLAARCPECRHLLMTKGLEYL